MQTIRRKVLAAFFPAASDQWLTILRVGLGIQVTLYSWSLRSDWERLLGGDGSGVISRDLSEAILSADGRFIPRVGWLITVGNQLGLGDDSIIYAVWISLLCAGCFLLIGFFCRPAAVLAWFLHLCVVKTASLQAYGIDNFTTIGLFYLMFAPLPDTRALDSRIWQPRPRDPHLQGFFQRVLQLHLCVVYFFSGITKSLGSEWWDGTSIWRSLTCAPFNVISPSALASLRYLLAPVGIAVLVLEIGYPFFIWPKRTRSLWLLCTLAMHIAIGFTMGLYLFAFVMIVLNLAAFGPAVLSCLSKTSLRERREMPAS